MEQQYIEEKLWFKKASAMKAHKAIDALTEPFKVPKGEIHSFAGSDWVDGRLDCGGSSAVEAALHCVTA